MTALNVMIISEGVYTGTKFTHTFRSKHEKRLSRNAILPLGGGEMAQSSLAVVVFNVGGGVGRNTVNLVNEFQKRGYRIDLVYVKGDQAFLDAISTHVNFVRLNAKSVPGMLTGLIQYLVNARPKVVFSSVDYTNLIVLFAKLISRIPTRVVISVHISLDGDRANHRTLKGRLKPLLFRIAYPLADAIVGVSDGVVGNLRRLGLKTNQALHRIYNPIFSDEIQAQSLATNPHHWFDKSGVPVIVAAGRLTAQKDFETLIRSFQLVRAERPAKLIILGEGPERGRIQKLIQELALEEDIDLPGFVSNPYKYMARARLFVLSSAWEGFGNVLVEALALGVPVVSTDCPYGPSEILDKGRYGLLVPVGDPEKMAEKILLGLSTSHDSSKLIKRAQEFSIVESANQYLRLFFCDAKRLTGVSQENIEK